MNQHSQKKNVCISVYSLQLRMITMIIVNWNYFRDQFNFRLRNSRYDMTEKLPIQSDPDTFSSWFEGLRDISPPRLTLMGGMIRLTEISPIRAPISPGFTPALWKNPVEPSISVRVENTPNYCPVCQNTTGLRLTYRLVKPLISSCFLPHSLSHRAPTNPARTLIWGYFFLRRRAGIHSWH